jgi:hypothetical protein
VAQALLQKCKQTATSRDEIIGFKVLGHEALIQNGIKQTWDNLSRVLQHAEFRSRRYSLKTSQ